MSIDRERIIDMLVKRDIESIVSDAARDDYSYLDSVLRGEGFTPYNQLSDDSLVIELTEYTGTLTGG